MNQSGKNEKSFSKQLSDSQYGVSPIPYHEHTGVDSPIIGSLNYQKLPNGDVIASISIGGFTIYSSNGISFEPLNDGRGRAVQNAAAILSSGVTSITAGNGISISSSTGDITISSSASAIPTGVILASSYTTTPPSGWLACDGSAYSRTIYAALYAVVGTSYGSGDGSTTFNVPNMLGRIPVGLNVSGDFVTLGAKIGEETHALTTAELASHTHTIPGGTGGSFASGAVAFQSNSPSTVNTGSTGSGTGHNNVQPSLVVGYYIIKT